jgi:hypothetical protein
LNPLFFEVFDLMYECETLADAPPIIIDLYDKNVLLKDTYLGRALIRIEDASTNTVTVETLKKGNLTDEEAKTIPKPKWHPIRFSNDESMPTTG